MSIQITPTGLRVQTFNEIFESLLGDWADTFALTSIQKEAIRTNIESPAGMILRIWAELEYNHQEKVHQLYDALSINAEGTNLDRVTQLVGIVRSDELKSELLGDALGDVGVIIPDGTKFQHQPTATIWESFDGPYEITMSPGVEIRLRCTTAGSVRADNTNEWDIVDSIPNLDSFESGEQTITGRSVESDAALRERAEIEIYGRSTGPLASIEAQVYAVPGVTYVRVHENTSMETDADGIPPKAVNTVVVGGNPDDIGAAIYRGRAGGIQAYGTDHVISIPVSVNESVSIGFDRIEDVPLYIQIIATTSTSEEPPTPAITSSIKRVVAEYINGLKIGEDVLMYRIAAAIHAAGIRGIDGMAIGWSLDDIAYETTKCSISIRQKASVEESDILVSTV
jgi:uncharacterized phage protein gp47/JayE